MQKIILNVCFIKFRCKHNSNVVLRSLRNLMTQTLFGNDAECFAKKDVFKVGNWITIEIGNYRSGCYRLDWQ